MSFIRRLHAGSIARTRAMPSKEHHHQLISDSVFPHGFLATGSHVGVKNNTSSNAPAEGPKDFALVVSTTVRTSSAATFTRNVFKAAPVQVSTEVLRGTQGRANKLILNSGCANAVTGTKGLEDAWCMAQTTDEAFPAFSNVTWQPGDSKKSAFTLVMSTGVIGQLLPINKILAGITSAATSMDASGGTRSSDPDTKLHSGFTDWERAARAFMTTDTFPKLRARTFTLPSITGSPSPSIFRIAGIDKGAGMIHPNMGPPHATLLGLIVTDAPIAPLSLQNALTYAVGRSFNSISVDGDMSTNDTVVAFANGAALDPEAEEIDEDKHPEAFLAFRNELTSFAIDLAKLIVYDGEGATKFVTVTVKNAPTYEHAHHVASTVSTSSLVKCALYGEDANWGRILCAVGYSPLTASAISTPVLSEPLAINPSHVSVSFLPADASAPLHVLVKGEPETVDEARASEVIGQPTITIEIDLGIGKESATYWTCDLSHEYVTINGDYRS